MAKNAVQLGKKIRLGDLLVEHKIISEEQLKQVLEEQKRSGHKIGRVLVENGFVEEDQLLNLLAEQLDVAYIDLSRFSFNPDIVKRIPETVARRYRVIALRQNGDDILVGMADPTNIFAYDELSRVLKCSISMAVVKERDLLKSIDMLYQRSSDIHSLASEMAEDYSENVFDINSLNQSAAKSDAPVVKLIESIFLEATKQHASDIHIEPDENLLRIRKRIDGILYEQIMDEHRIASGLTSRLKLMAGLNISEKRLPQDGRFNLKVENRSVDVRVATMPTTNGETVVLRLLDRSQGIQAIDKLGFESQALTQVVNQLRRPHGIILVTGPTGSGKTTTLYSMLNELNHADKKIIAVEDPVEYQMERINQVQVNPKIGLDFSNVLRSSLRADPDIIFVGEIRDTETADIALRAAMTGHLVLSSLHTNDSISSVIRLMDMGVEPFLIASALNMVIAQRLVRKICDACRRPVELSSGDQSWLASIGADNSFTYSEGVGCNHCNHSGYHGRIAIHEVLVLDDQLQSFIRHKDIDGFKNAASERPGFLSLRDVGMKLAEYGTTSVAEVMRVSGWIG